MRRFSQVVISLVVLCGIISLVLGACFRDRLKKDGDEEYCEYAKLRFYPGSVFLTPDCNNCTCSDNGLSCCGYGKGLLGVMGNPPWCKTVTRGCKVELICRKPPYHYRIH